MTGKSLLRLCAFLFLFSVMGLEKLAAQDAPTQNTTPAAARLIGTVTTISGQIITMKTDAGAELTVTVTDSTKLLQLKPGQTNLKDATPLILADLKAGDRILVRGVAAADGKSVQAASMIAMKQGDIADKQARERAEWAQHSAGGLVKSVDAVTGTISISTNAVGTQKEIVIHTTGQTVLRRYAAGSVKFDDAKPAPIAEIKAGDQLRARGQRSADGGELAADEIVSGTFRSIAGILLSSDNASGTITVTDLATKQPVTLRVSGDSQLRKLPQMLAQRIAMRFAGAPADGASGPAKGQGAPSTPTPTQGSAPAASGGGMGPGGSGPGAGAGPGVAPGTPPGANGQARGGDLQQMIARMPAASLTDLAKGDTLMIVATEGSAGSPSTIITLLGGVEPILRASSKATPDMILSPWSLGAGGGEGATP